jgi:putative restriction endonuclease
MPKHHILFDFSAFSINDDFSLIGIDGFLNVNSKHKINLNYIRYHREHYPLQNL